MNQKPKLRQSQKLTIPYNKRSGTALVTQSSGSPTQVETGIGTVAHATHDNEQGQMDVKCNKRKSCVLCNKNHLIAKCPKSV